MYLFISEELEKIFGLVCEIRVIEKWMGHILYTCRAC